MMREDNGNPSGSKGAWPAIGRNAWRLVLTAVTCIGAYASLWMKANVPSREQFEAFQGNTREQIDRLKEVSATRSQFEVLQAQVQSMRDEMIKADLQGSRRDFELRLRELERKFPRRGGE